MNGILSSEATLLQPYKHSYTGTNSQMAKDHFSDLVPSYVTVESVLNLSRLSFNQFNPVTASNLSHNAVMISSVEKFSKMTRLNTLGTSRTVCTPTVTFFKKTNKKIEAVEFICLSDN